MRAIMVAMVAGLLGSAAMVSAQKLPSDIPANFKQNRASFDYQKREAEVKMRDGVKLHVVMIVPKGAAHAPILLERTPYSADDSAGDDATAFAGANVRPAFAELLDAGYILAFEDVRGKYGSGGVYVNERPLIGPDNDSKVDHATDAYDTIDWLVKNVPETNGRVGMLGTSYDGMMVAMALTDPHPALKAAVPMNPVINTWMGDDDFHGGAARNLISYDYYYAQDSVKGSAGDIWRDAYDDYTTFLDAGNASNFVKSRGLEQLPVVQRLHDHPAYDAYWQAQALEDILPKKVPTVPTLWVASQWDQEDMYGAVAAYEALEKVDTNHVEHLALGPWHHGGWAGDGSSLGEIDFHADTARWFRHHVMIPFLDAHLKDGAPPADIAPVTAFQTGTDEWQRLDRWPANSATQRLYLQSDDRLGFSAPTQAGSDSYVSDPAKPIPYRIRPIRPTYASGSTWSRWLVDDQRQFATRTDVLTFKTPVLTSAVSIAGAAVANIVAATTGTDGDFVVKLIDEYPAEYAPKHELGGYQLGIAMDILRGRYREGFTVAKPITPDTPLTYRFALPNADHVFLPGHRIVVQIQSSWFPLYDRNPQTFVPNIFDAPADAYKKATISVYHGPDHASFIELPTRPATTGD